MQASYFVLQEPCLPCPRTRQSTARGRRANRLGARRRVRAAPTRRFAPRVRPGGPTQPWVWSPSAWLTSSTNCWCCRAKAVWARARCRQDWPGPWQLGRNGRSALHLVPRFMIETYEVLLSLFVTSEVIQQIYETVLARLASFWREEYKCQYTVGEYWLWCYLYQLLFAYTLLALWWMCLLTYAVKIFFFNLPSLTPLANSPTLKHGGAGSLN